MSVRANERADVSRGYHIGMFIARNSIGLLTKDDWNGMENLPADGGFLVCANHISHADPFAVARFLYDVGHPPYFLAKEALFKLPLFGRVMTGAQQIPVRRGSDQAGEAYRMAVETVDAGRCVVVMPESTITNDPDKWPMTGKTGAARIALATGRPVIPLAQWGAQHVRHRDTRVMGRGRVLSHMLVGPPVPLDDLRGRPIDAMLLREATERIMTAITTELETLRDGQAPAGRWDMRVGKRVEQGTQEDHP